jgi:hypothetical protein
MPLRPFVAIPKDLREWSVWMRDQVITADDDTVATSAIQDEAVTYAKIQDVAADRILGRLSTLGVVSELTAAQLVTLLEAEGWTFAGTIQFDGNIGFYGTTPIAQPSNITDASVAHALNPIFSDTEVEAALDALGAKFNDLKDNVIEALGLSA